MHQPGFTGTRSSAAGKEQIIKFPSKNLPSVLAAGDENEHRVSEERAGWGDAVNAALCVHSSTSKSLNAAGYPHSCARHQPRS